MALFSALAQEGVSRVSSFISTKLDDRASRAHLVARLEMALSRLEFVLDWSTKQPITYVSLLRCRKMLKNAYMEGAALLIKHKQQVQEGHEEAGQLVTSPSYLKRIIATAAEFPIVSSLASGLNKQQCLSSSVVQKFEWYADCANKFVADVESACPPRRDITLRYPFVRQLLQGKHIVARLEMALFRLEFVLEWSRKQPITYVSLIRRWKMLKSAYMEGADLLSKHKQQVLEGHEEAEQLVTSPSYLERIIASAAEFSISSLAGLNKQQCLSSSVVQNFEWHADCADKFVADVESACPLQRVTFFPYPFVRQLLQGKYLSYDKVKGSQRFRFDISPLVLEGRGVEACLRYWYECFDPERLDKSFSLQLMLRLSESTDIVGTAIDCVRSSASLLNLPALEAIIGHLTQVRNLQEISDSYASPQVGFEKYFASLSTCWRPDPLCCQRDGHGPSANSTNSSELSHLFQEQTIHFRFSCYVSALEYNLPLKLDLGFTPHRGSNSFVSETMGSKNEDFPFGSIEQTVDMTRSRSVEFLIRQPEVKDYSVYWRSRHGWASFRVEKPRIDMTAVPKASGSRYNTRSAAAKRKRT